MARIGAAGPKAVPPISFTASSAPVASISDVHTPTIRETSNTRERA